MVGLLINPSPDPNPKLNRNRNPNRNRNLSRNRNPNPYPGPNPSRNPNPSLNPKAFSKVRVLEIFPSTSTSERQTELVLLPVAVLPPVSKYSLNNNFFCSGFMNY